MVMTSVVPGRHGEPVTEPADLEVPERASRRTYSAQYKLRILAEYERRDRDGKGALLRREGLYTSLISEWRKQRDQGALQALAAGPGRPAADTRDQELAQLRVCWRLTSPAADLSYPVRVWRRPRRHPLHGWRASPGATLGVNPAALQSITEIARTVQRWTSGWSVQARRLVRRAARHSLAARIRRGLMGGSTTLEPKCCPTSPAVPHRRLRPRRSGSAPWARLDQRSVNEPV
jgi:transposase-like protein